MLLVEKQYGNIDLAGCYNVGPNEEDWWTTGELVSLFCREWKSRWNVETAMRKIIEWSQEYLERGCFGLYGCAN